MRRANDLLSTSVSRECMWRRDMKRRKKRCRLQTSTSWNVPQSQAIEMEPECIAASVRLAEKEVLPMIKDRQCSLAAAAFLLAQRTKAQVTGDPRLISELAMLFANTVLARCQAGIFTRGPTYLYTCEETLQELPEGPKAKRNDEAYFQPFTLKPRATLEQSATQVGREGSMQRLQPVMYRQMQSQADGEPKQLPYERRLYLL